MTETQTPQSKKATLVAVAPLLLMNALTVYGQGSFAYTNVAPGSWPLLGRLVLAVMFAMSVESIALYVGWHAHDALLLRSHGTARTLRRYSYLIALVVAAMNYTHFAAKGHAPTAAAIAFAMLSLLSPWVWGLHTRRAARLQLLKERRADEGGAVFSSERTRAFPVRTWKARRYSIDYGITDPMVAWNMYHGRVEGPSVRPSTPSVPSTSSKAAGWDVELAVKVLLDGGTPDFVTPKPLQLLRRCVRFLQEGMDVDEVAAKVPCSLKHVMRVKAAMGE